jgi:two-component system CheB/CheR fusion protein
MKDDTSTPTTDGSSPNEFERDKPGTTARDAAEAAIEDLRQRGGVFVNAVRATGMPMVMTDPNLRGNPIVFANEPFLRLSGYRMEDVLGQQPHFMNGPDTDPRDAARFAEALRCDQDDIIEAIQYRKDGSRFVATVLLSAHKDEEGRTLNHFMSWLDVTRRVDAEFEAAELRRSHSALTQSERRANVLLAELQHRVRNTLAVARSIARRTAERSSNMEEMLSHFEGRLNAFARIQSAVTRSLDPGIELSAIIEDELLAVAAREGDQLRIRGPAIFLAPRPAETISLAIHELATNAVKYGALSTGNGCIAVSWRQEREGDHEQLMFIWHETGAPLPPEPAAGDGFGHEMLRRTLPYELGAETDIEFTDDGLRFTMKMPLGRGVLAEGE